MGLDTMANAIIIGVVLFLVILVCIVIAYELEFTDNVVLQHARDGAMTIGVFCIFSLGIDLVILLGCILKFVSDSKLLWGK